MSDSAPSQDATAPSANQVNLNDPRIRSIFYPYTDEKTRELRADATSRVAYYTTAETAFHILRNKEFWMRNTATMNDYLEVEHGFDCLKAAYESDSGKFFQTSLDSVFPGLTARATERFDAWLPGIRSDTYITCFSEHLQSEDAHGRLSMWRAYGGRAGVALILKPDVMFAENSGIGVFASPVAYWTQEQVQSELQRIGERIAAQSDYVSSLGSTAVEAIVFNMFRFAVLCTKHPGFAEEREWRVISSPAMFSSPLLTSAVELVRGIPQTIQRVSLRSYPEVGLDSLEPRNLFDRVVIGPCDYPAVIWRALSQLLEACDVQNAGTRVSVSQIPLRVMSS
jgi:Protein of unknown function (DUF2971)